MSAVPTAVDMEAGAAPPAPPAPPPSATSNPETVSIRVDLLDRIVKRLDILLEMQRRSSEAIRPDACRQCGGRADYSVVYDGLVTKKAAAHVCEACMEGTVVHEAGMEIYPWKRDIASMKCIRCGDDVTRRGWCVCPRNAKLAAGNGNDGRRHGRAQEAAAQ